MTEKVQNTQYNKRQHPYLHDKSKQHDNKQHDNKHITIGITQQYNFGRRYNFRMARSNSSPPKGGYVMVILLLILIIIR